LSLAFYDVYRDPLMASDANITQGLQKIMQLSAHLQEYCCGDGTTKPMTLAQAMEADKSWGSRGKY
jgi:hypothetical protein